LHSAELREQPVDQQQRSNSNDLTIPVLMIRQSQLAW